MTPRIAAISTGPDTHLDHIGVLCAELKIPLYVTEDSTYQLALKYYPSLEVSLKDHRELSLEYIATNLDMILGCGKFWVLELLPIIEMLYKKKMRLVFCPHGNSDKGHSITPEKNISQDIALVYGDHMLELLEKTGALEKTSSVIRTGNYRLPFYRKNKSFYDGIIHSEILNQLDPQKKTILYAPTWQDSETPTSFFQVCEELIEQLAHSYNLIIKLHPFLEEHYPAHTFHILAKYETHPQVVFLNNFPLIYPLLAHCDIYLGDFSSVGYDFLAFDKPMFFFNPRQSDPEKNRGLFLHRCGIEIPHSELGSLESFISKNLRKQESFSSIRKEIYEFSFGSEREPMKIKEEIVQAYST